MQRDLEGPECQLGIWAFCWAVETSGINHVVMDEAGPTEGHSSQHSAWGLLHARSHIRHWIDTRLIKRDTVFAALRLQPSREDRQSTNK